MNDVNRIATKPGVVKTPTMTFPYVIADSFQFFTFSLLEVKVVFSLSEPGVSTLVSMS